MKFNHLAAFVTLAFAASSSFALPIPGHHHDQQGHNSTQLGSHGSGSASGSKNSAMNCAVSIAERRFSTCRQRPVSLTLSNSRLPHRLEIFNVSPKPREKSQI